MAGVAIVAIGGAIGAILLNQTPKPEPIVNQPKPVTKPKPPVIYYSKLTGEKVEKETDITTPVTAIMIENSPDARPQSGIKDAEVIYEAIAEGGITRFLTIYQNKKPKLVGPVRSLRLYYVDWLAPYNASVAHVGGSRGSLNEIRNGKYRDIDEFSNSSTYWRASDRYAPHNVYTNFSRIDAINNSKGYTESNFESFPRVDSKPAETPDASSININFSSPAYNTAYKYDSENNRYVRSMAGQLHLDRESGQITPSVVIAMRVNMQHVIEDGYRESITTTGQGEATIFQNGTATKATWKKDNRFSPLKLVNSSGEDIPLVRGQTWIAAVPNSGGSVSWQ